MTRTRIESLGVFLPPKVVTTQEWLDGCRFHLSMPLEHMTGIRSRHVGGEGNFSIDLAEKAAADCLRHSGYQASDIDLILACNISRCDGPGLRVSYEPSCAATLAARLGIEAPGYNVANACAGMMTGAWLADAYLKNGAARCVLVVAGEYCSHMATTAQLEITSDTDPRIACLTTGDAGAAFILDQAIDDSTGFHHLAMYTLGAYSDACTAGPTPEAHGGAVMLTDAVRMTAAGRPHIMQDALNALQRVGWQPEDVHRLIPHQTSRSSVKEGIKTINALLGRELCNAKNVVDNIRERGNTGPTTHALAMSDLIQKDDLRSGDRVLLGISGSGLTIGTGLYHLDDLPARLTEGGKAAHAPEAAPPVLTPVQVVALGLSDGSGEGQGDDIALGVRAAEQCLSAASIAREEIDLVICAGQYRTGYMVEPAAAAFIAGRLGLNGDIAWNAAHKTLAFDIMAGAGGMLAAIDAAAQTLRASLARCALVVAAEVDENRRMREEPPRGIAQRGSAMLLRLGDSGLGRVHWLAQPEHCRALQTWVRQVEGKTLLCVQQDAQYEALLIGALARVANTALAAAHLKIADVDVVLGPQRPGDFAKRLSQAMGGARVFDLGSEQDLFTSSLPAAWHARAGKTALLLDGGSGIQVGAALYRA